MSGDFAAKRNNEPAPNWKIYDLKKLFHNKYADWHDILSESVTTPENLSKYLPVNIDDTKKVTDRYPMLINPYFLSLMLDKGSHIIRQAVPDPAEIEDCKGSDDPLCEEKQSPVPNLAHRYPDRVLFMVSNRCAVYCRFCMRKRKIGRPFIVTDSTINSGIEYIKNNKSIREVVISGGDPLLLEDDALNRILEALRSIRHVEVLRIHTRIPCAMPQRITKNLSDLLSRFHPLFINIHFNHPDEITDEAAHACALLAGAGIPLGSQTVLLKGVNDDPDVMQNLMKKLLTVRIRPYYLHHPDVVRGTSHFRNDMKKGMEVMKSLHGRLSGMCLPHYMIDLPGGGGKVPLLPEYVRSWSESKISVENYKGEIFSYPAAGS
jgi:lysine 2,3-aminomutase